MWGPLAPPPGKEALAVQSPIAIPPLLFLKSHEMEGGTCKCPSLLASVLSCCVWLCSSQLSVTTGVLCTSPRTFCQQQQAPSQKDRKNRRVFCKLSQPYELASLKPARSCPHFKCQAGVHNVPIPRTLAHPCLLLARPLPESFPNHPKPSRGLASASKCV